MRTTVTLDADVAARLRALARQRGISFKEALNQAVRAGLRARREGPPPPPRYTQPMGLRQGVDLDRALQLAAALEDQEILRKLEVRK
jgi:class 3 adenylate cyclase